MRAYAERCESLAAQTNSPDYQKALLSIAAQWRQLIAHEESQFQDQGGMIGLRQQE